MFDENVEVSKSQLKVLQDVYALKEALWNDPVQGPKIKEIVKEKYPQANIPEVDLVRAARQTETEVISKVDAAKKELDDRITAFETRQREKEDKEANEKVETKFASEIEATKKKYQLTAEGMEKVFARMKEKNNPDVDSAAAWVTDHEVKAKPVASSSYAPQDMNLYGSSQGDSEWAELNRDPVKYGDKVLGEMINDFQNGNFGRYKEFGGTV